MNDQQQHYSTQQHHHLETYLHHLQQQHALPAPPLPPPINISFATAEEAEAHVRSLHRGGTGAVGQVIYTPPSTASESNNGDEGYPHQQQQRQQQQQQHPYHDNDDVRGRQQPGEAGLAQSEYAPTAEVAGGGALPYHSFGQSLNRRFYQQPTVHDEDDDEEAVISESERLVRDDDDEEDGGEGLTRTTTVTTTATTTTTTDSEAPGGAIGDRHHHRRMMSSDVTGRSDFTSSQEMRPRRGYRRTSNDQTRRELRELMGQTLKEMEEKVKVGSIYTSFLVTLKWWTNTLWIIL